MLCFTWLHMKTEETTKPFQAHLKLSSPCLLICGKFGATICCAVYYGYLAFLQVIPTGTFVSHRKRNHNFKTVLNYFSVFKVVFTFFLNPEFSVPTRLPAVYTDRKLVRLNCSPGLIMGSCIIIQWKKVFLQLEFELLEDQLILHTVL